jgi:hypothetical protein
MKIMIVKILVLLFGIVTGRLRILPNVDGENKIPD